MKIITETTTNMVKLIMHLWGNLQLKILAQCIEEKIQMSKTDSTVGRHTHRQALLPC